MTAWTMAQLAPDGAARPGNKLDNDANRSGQNEDRSGSGRGVAVPGRGWSIRTQSQAAQGEGGEPVGVNGNAIST
jgi:hypothetical protein